MNRRVVVLGALASGCAIPPRVPVRRAPAPELEATDLDGAAFRLSELRGNVVLLNHFATWCPPCVREMPALVSMHRDLHENGLRIVGLDVAEDPEVVRAFVARHGLAWRVAILPRETNPFKVRGIPTNVLVDREGIVCARWSGYSRGLERSMRKEIALALT